MAARIIARKIGDARLEAGDIVTIRDGSHQWTSTEQEQIGKRWVEIVVDEDPPGDPNDYKQPLAVLEARRRSTGELLETVPWDGSKTVPPNIPKGKFPVNYERIETKRRRFQADVSEITDRVEFKTWADFEATLTDKRGQ